MGIGWMAGLITIQMLNNYFEKSGWINAWGLFSNKIILSESTFMIIEWIITAFIVMKVTNKIFQLFLKKSKINI
jgi:hypothetical protein